ncbi:hypothetical protein EXN66_Car001153 [Channa argus]|uniref:Uncharacterized protein n=1 Tax=Channa argus TaxID=215402 RepID=A0A6G1QZ64_CHAAH|nr:hypothetical protein EXN66_Car001153 [Channa argus]
MPPLLIWIFSFGLQTYGSTQAINCAVTQDAGGTCYSVTQFSGTDCYYSWTNGTGHVVANHAAKMEYLVVTQNISTLTTNRCLKEIHYIRDCISEGIRREVTCSSIHISYWIMMIIVAAVLLVGPIIYFVSYRKGHCYTPVMSNVEAQ